MSNATRECTSCQSVIAANSAKCAKCGEWQEDIKKERNLCYLWSFITVLPVIAFFVGKSKGWWRPETSSTSGPFRKLGAIFATFDWGTFFASPSGLLLIAAFGVTLGLCLRYYVSVSRKMGNWIWL